MGNTEIHSAEAAALGFYYQTFLALLEIIKQSSDNAAVCLERLDDVEISANGSALLLQLKHSMQADPPPITIKSSLLWRTLKAWIDVFPRLSLSETLFQLVTVAKIAEGDPLSALLTPNSDRKLLNSSLVEEAQRVVAEREAAKSAGKDLPHADRVAACETFLRLDEGARKAFLAKITIRPGSPDIGGVEERIADELRVFPAPKRVAIARRLISWWDREVVYTLCGKRERFIALTEVQLAVSEIAADIEREALIPEFEGVMPPEDYQPDGMLARQIELVNGTSTDLRLAIREEWRAREQRSKWINERLDMATKINDYDRVLAEHWSDRHSGMCEECADVSDEQKCLRGRALLRWSHESASSEVRPFAQGWTAPYFIRGSYQVLAIGLQVGWHPQYKDMLGDEA